MFDSFHEQEIKDISNDVTNDIDIDQNEVLFREPEFVVKGKSLEKIFKKIKPKKKLERFSKKNKIKVPKTKIEKRFHKKGQ